jgi:hypothetical protein
MHDIFNGKRFAFLFRKTLLERPIQTFGFTGLILLIILIIYFICKALMGFGPAQNISFIWGLAGGGCFFASLQFGYFASNASGSSFLTLPASAFEKWLCAVLTAGLLYPLIFLHSFAWSMQVLSRSITMVLTPRVRPTGYAMIPFISFLSPAWSP